MADAATLEAPYEVRPELLDGGQDVILAPVRGPDRRRELPAELFQRAPGDFSRKFLFALALIAASYATIALVRSWITTVAAILVLGLMYAHLVELQHETLHEHAFVTRFLNRLCGFVCGLFMLSSYSHYKYQHLRHHANLGKPENKEFFNYRFRGLNSPWGFVRAAFDMGRFADVARDIVRSWVGKPIPAVRQDRERKRIAQEYRLILILLVAAVAVTVWTRQPFLLVAWLLPLLLIAEPAHFLIELPEHFGLNTQTDSNVLTNTRTIRAGWFTQWFTNFNNLHTAHHYHQGVPMANVRRLSDMVEGEFQVIEESYWSFYRKVLRGELTVDPSQTCMTRP